MVDVLVSEALATHGDTVGFEKCSDGSFGQMMLGHKLVRGDARLVFGDDFVDLCPTHLAFQGMGTAGFDRFRWTGFGGVDLFAQVSVGFLEIVTFRVRCYEVHSKGPQVEQSTWGPLCLRITLA